MQIHAKWHTERALQPHADTVGRDMLLLLQWENGLSNQLPWGSKLHDYGCNRKTLQEVEKHFEKTTILSFCFFYHRAYNGKNKYRSHCNFAKLPQHQEIPKTVNYQGFLNCTGFYLLCKTHDFRNGCIDKVSRLGANFVQTSQCVQSHWYAASRRQVYGQDPVSL